MTSVWPWIISFSRQSGRADRYAPDVHRGPVRSHRGPILRRPCADPRRPGATALPCLFQGPGADSPEHIARALTFENEGVDAGVVQQLTEQQTGRTGANDGNLGFRASLFLWLPRSTRPGSLSEFYGSSACIFHLRVCQLRVKTEPISVHSANRCDYRPSSISRPGLK